MSFPNENLRPIQYPLDRSQGLEYNTGLIETIDEPFSWSTEDPDERVTITLTLSLNEYVALASAVDVGRDIAYGQASLAIWWIWVRSINTMDFCEQVDDCIANNLTTQITINNTLLSNGIINPDQIQPLSPEMNNRFPPEERNTDISTPPEQCDKDKLWAGILETVTRLDELGLDFLQDVVSHNDKAERIANIIDIVPLFGDIAADVITVFSDIAPDLLNGYLAHSSQQVLEDTACALFEMVCEDCRYPTYDEYYDYYSNFGITGIGDIVNLSITAIMDYLIGSNNLGNAVIWYSMNVGVLFTLYLGGTFANRRGKRWLDIWAKIGEESPSSAWEVLCEGCGEIGCIEYDFTTSAHGFTVWSTGSRPFGVYVPSTGWQCTWNNVSGINDNRIYIEKINMPDDFDISRVEVDYVALAGGANRGTAIRGTNGTANQSATAFSPKYTSSGALLTDDTAYVKAGIDGVRFNLTSDTNSTNQTAYTLKKMRVYYTSTLAPEGGSPC